MSKISKKSRKGMKEIFKATVNLCNWIYPTLGMVTPIQSAVTPISEIQSILCDAVSPGSIYKKDRSRSQESLRPPNLSLLSSSLDHRLGFKGYRPYRRLKT